MLACDATFSHDALVENHDGDAPVVEIVQAVVGVDVGQLRIMAQGAEEAERVITEVAASARDENWSAQSFLLWMNQRSLRSLRPSKPGLESTPQSPASTAKRVSTASVTMSGA